MFFPFDRRYSASRRHWVDFPLLSHPSKTIRAPRWLPLLYWAFIWSMEWLLPWKGSSRRPILEQNNVLIERNFPPGMSLRPRPQVEAPGTSHVIQRSKWRRKSNAELEYTNLKRGYTGAIDCGIQNWRFLPWTNGNNAVAAGYTVRMMPRNRRDSVYFVACPNDVVRDILGEIQSRSFSVHGEEEHNVTAPVATLRKYAFLPRGHFE